MSDQILIKSKAIPSNPRSKNYPAGATVVRSGNGGGSTVITGSGGTNIDIIKVDDMRSLTDKNILSSLRVLAEILSRIIKSDDEAELSEENTLSSLRIRQELDAAIESLKDLYISKVKNDTATGLITFLKGLISEELIEANNGLVVRSSKTLSKLQSQISDSLSELDEDSIMEFGDEGSLSTALLELPLSNVVTGTLGGLDNVSNATDAIDTKDVVLVKQKGGILWEPIGIDKMRGKDGVIVYPTMNINVHTGHLILSVPTNNYENQFKVTNGHLILHQNG